MVRTPCICCRGHGLIPGLGAKIPHATRPKEKICVDPGSMNLARYRSRSSPVGERQFSLSGLVYF